VLDAHLVPDDVVLAVRLPISCATFVLRPTAMRSKWSTLP
jgi:hypothetical protein